VPFIEAPTTFYIGRRYDPATRRLVDEVVYYDSRDLNTHAVVVGMTGSGKTGLCIDLLEEAALDGVGRHAPRGGDQRPDLATPDVPPAPELDALELAGSSPAPDRGRAESYIGGFQDRGRLREGDPV